MRSAFIANGGGKFCRFVYLSEPCCAQGRAIKKTQVSRKIGYFTTLRTLHNAPHERAKQIIANGTATASVKPIPTASLIAMEKLSETFRRNSDGTTDLDAIVVREGKNLPGRVFGAIVGSIGKRKLEHDLANTVKAIEARHYDTNGS